MNESVKRETIAGNVAAQVDKSVMGVSYANAVATDGRQLDKKLREMKYTGGELYRWLFRRPFDSHPAHDSGKSLDDVSLAERPSRSPSPQNTISGREDIAPSLQNVLSLADGDASADSSIDPAPKNNGASLSQQASREVENLLEPTVPPSLERKTIH